MATFPISATHMHLLPTGKVMFYGEFEEGVKPPQSWDPATGSLSPMPTADYNIFCTGHSWLADGRMLVTGGHVESHVGLPHTSIFNPFTLKWSRGPDMNDNRWYPTNTTLQNGQVVVLSGETHASGSTNPLPQVWQPESGKWRNLITAVRDLPYYPRMFLSPTGKLFFAGPQRASRWLDPEGTGTWYDGPRGEFTAGRSYGSAVMYGSKVLIMGGGSPPTNTVEEIDLADPKPTWRLRAPMKKARRQINATLLPDGKVLVTGGSGGKDFDDNTQPVKVPELYDPETNTWTSLAPAAEYRGYHSTALLLPDGRVINAGGRKRHTVEIFSPPYLKKGGAPRPTIGFVAPAISPGSDFFVQSEDAARITKVTMIALGSVTHAFDQNQRFLNLSFKRTGIGLTVSAPEDNFVAPPGYYMLFVLDSRGVPSVGKMVRVINEVPRERKEITFSDEWKYDDRGINHGSSWLAADFDDSQWKSGAGQLGYGDGDEGTLLKPGAPSVYFRKKITLANTVTSATLEALYDDGIAVWVNGVLVFSRDVGNGMDFNSWATASTTNAYARAPVPLKPSNPFRIGENVITAMVKQVSASSPDLTFALSLDVEQAVSPLLDSVMLTSPMGGEVLEPGTSLPITWSSIGQLPGVNLEYSLNGGNTWTEIASSVPDTGVYFWKIPDTSTYDGLLRVSRVGSPGVSDVSKEPFTIRRSTTVVAIPFQSTWRYLDTGEDPGVQWTQKDFDDSSWRQGAGQLGYGDGDEGTVLQASSPAQTSVYFRKKLLVNGAITDAHLNVLFDDGIAVFINGTQVFSRNMEKGFEHEKYASSSTENELAGGAIPAKVFVQGENTLAVMVKQAGATSPDLSFDLELQLGFVPNP
ncbi:galactose oxidase-like domain-containing protein [Melittangium boletus]|uniref:galactose oxidase-like domain-containing protein n=1 Tax=Melittangium boletus TaxID=83453 RepID=UPI001FEA0913|nr:galactose oxidase-like domain-containing protein [Melittangium boletus]